MAKRSTETKNVCLIYTGGTIGMLYGEHGFQPEPFYLTSALRNQSRFHDPLGDSLFSNSSSIEEWRNHNLSTSGIPSTPRMRPDGFPASDSSVLPVRSTRPILQADGTSISVEISDSVYETLVPTLITPSSSTDKRVRYVVHEWQPILDSSNIEASDWIRLATEIELNYATFDAFIVLHGTDTICYTTSALSYLLEDLGKTVIVTGAQIPLSQLRNDAVDNLLGSLSIAGRYIIPECCLYFNHCLYRGNRVSKVSSFDLEAFASPNFPPLVDVGTDIVVNWRNILVSRSIRRFRAHKSMCTDVATLRLFPGITAATIKSFFAPPIKGVVLESFGAGNAPERRDLLDAIKCACDAGIVIVTISQCARGSVSSHYAAGRSLVDAGVVLGMDMTPEAALTKLSYLLSKPELSIKEVRKLMTTPLRGELTAHHLSEETRDVINTSPGVQGIVTHLLRLTTPPAPESRPGFSRSQSQSTLNAKSITSSIPSIQENGINLNTPGPTKSLSAKARDVTASWSLTDSDTHQTEQALLPYLIHIAASKNDVPTILFCVSAASSTRNDSPFDDPTSSGTVGPSSYFASEGGAGVCNSLDPCSRSPLHTAALNGHLEAVRALLENGASVHLRDLLDHTALYYAMRQSHYEIVQLLEETGAILAGSDKVNPLSQSIAEDLGTIGGQTL